MLRNWTIFYSPLCSGRKRGHFHQNRIGYVMWLELAGLFSFTTLPVGSRVDRASVTETVDMGSIPGQVNPKTTKLSVHTFLLDVQQLKGQCKASTMCDRQVGRWQLDLKTERSLRYLPSPDQGNLWIKCDYYCNYNLRVVIVWVVTFYSQVTLVTTYYLQWCMSLAFENLAVYTLMFGWQFDREI